MIKLFVTAICLVMLCNSCRTTKSDQPKLIFDETFNQSSSFCIAKNYIGIVDTSFNQGGEIASITKYNFLFNKNIISKIDSNIDSILLSDKQNIIITNLAQYSFIGTNTLPQILQAKKDTTQEVHNVKETEKFIFYVSRSNIGECFLNVYNKEKEKSSKISVGNYLDYYPEIFLHDFNKDGIPEVFLFIKFYMQNHYLIDVKSYKL
jgi:hypothetical protein